jgi:hypothetical protein
LAVDFKWADIRLAAQHSRRPGRLVEFDFWSILIFDRLWTFWTFGRLLFLVDFDFWSNLDVWPILILSQIWFLIDFDFW